jgi:DNA-binding transcriptional LysR family regulator
MELYQLRTFIKVAQEGNLTRAAEQLFTSQPAISAHIKALEEELGVTLFQRTPKGMSLTAEGELLCPRAEGILQAAEGLKNEALELRSELVGEVRLGVHTDYQFMAVGALQQLLAGRHPRVRPHFIQGMSATIVPDVRKNRLDGGFFFGPCDYADLSVTHLREVPMAVAAPAAWGERVEAASVEQLAALPWIYTSEDCPFFSVGSTLFDLDGIEPRKVAFADSEDAVRELIRADAGVSLLRLDDALALEKRGLACRWPGEVPSIALQFAVQKRRQQEPLIRALVEIISEFWQLDTGQVNERVAE